MSQPQTPITVVIADDHPLIREGFASILNGHPDIEMVAAVENGILLIAATHTHRPLVVVTDVKMPEMSAPEAVGIIKSKYPETKVIAISMYDDLALVQQLLNAGISGFLLKDAGEHELVTAIKTVAAGGEYFCKVIEKKVEQIRQKEKKPADKVVFTKREIEIMRLIAQGKSNGEIAGMLCISLRTVETHRHSLYQKIGVNNAVGVALYAKAHGYLDEVKV